MKQHEYRARIKNTKRKAREEFVLLEEFVNTGHFDSGPFMCRGKKVHYSVGKTDYVPSVPGALARVRAMSEQYWPKEKHEGCSSTPDTAPASPSASGAPDLAPEKVAEALGEGGGQREEDPS